MKKLSIIATAILLAALTASPGWAAPQELKFSHVGSPGSLFDLSAQHFAQLANAKLGDRYKVVVYGSSQLGGDKELLEKLRLGTVDFALPSTVMSSEVDLFGLFELPYLVRDRDHMKRIEKAIFWPVLAPAADKRGYKILAVWENGFRQITNNARPIVKPADLKGLKLRVPQGKWRVKMFEAYGASPSPMKLSEVFVALQTGVMDGQENPLSQIYASKFQEVQKYLSMTGHVYTPAYVTAGAKKFATLPPDVQKILIDAARQNQAFVYVTAARQDKELLGKMKAAGMKVNEADKDAFIAASKPIYAEFAKEVPGAQKLIDEAIKLGKTH
ncbi:MAG: TRAP transporter substrate-binding protein [Alphaproteobacteria bacterium]|nr:TRAP transporter substrate-binding protein [Alphaproteobacteria bacterium]